MECSPLPSGKPASRTRDHSAAAHRECGKKWPVQRSGGIFAPAGSFKNDITGLHGYGVGSAENGGHQTVKTRMLDPIAPHADRSSPPAERYVYRSSHSPSRCSSIKADRRRAGAMAAPPYCAGPSSGSILGHEQIKAHSVPCIVLNTMVHRSLEQRAAHHVQHPTAQRDERRNGNL